MSGDGVGIAIVNYRSTDALSALLARWSSELEGTSRIHEVVVVDNDPTSATAPSASAGLPLRYLRVPRNRGYAAGVNTAWQEIDSPYVLLLNAAAWIGLDAIESLAAVLGAHPQVGAVAPLHVDRQGEPINRYHTLPSWLDLLSHGTHLHRLAWARRRTRKYQCEWLDGIDPTWPLTPVEQPPASCLLLRRSAVTAPPMDERLPMLFNDVDLSRTLRSGGWDTLVAPYISCRHQPATSTRYLGVRTRAEAYLGAYRYVRKWEGPARGNAYRGLLAASLLLSARDGSVRRENLHAVGALVTDRSLFEIGDDADPVRRFWPAQEPA